MNFSETDKAIVRAMQSYFPICARPYQALADKLGINEEELLQRLQAMKQQGVIRKMGTVLRHRDVGFRANALCVWMVKESEMDRVARIMCQHPRVTHCYDRNTAYDWPFNFYTMIHGTTNEECQDIAAELARQTGVQEYQLLFTEKEWKKTSMCYFAGD